MARGLKFTKTVKAKGRVYTYFDTGQTGPGGKTIYTRLPPVGTPQFGAAYASMCSARTRRNNLPTTLTVRELIRMYQLSPKFSGLAEGSKRLYVRYLAVFEDELGPAPAQEISAADVTKMMDLRGKTPGAANMLLRTIAALYKWARSRQHVSNEPTKHIELFEEGEHDPWPEGLLGSALEAGDHSTRLAVALLYYTAQRLDDVRLMRWADIKDGSICCRQQKTGKAMTIPIHSELVKVLNDTPRTGLQIIAKPDGRAYSQQTIRKWLQQFAAERGFKIVPHGLRKNAVNALLEAGCSAAETAAISGQSLSMVEHYAKKRDMTVLGKTAVLKWEKRHGGKK